MSEEIRVTVVATGLDKDQSALEDAPLPGNVEMLHTPKAATPAESMIPNFGSDLDQPALGRKQQAVQQDPAPQVAMAGAGGGSAVGGADLLDIPAFLRRQAE
jgi:hypothetical protein